MAGMTATADPAGLPPGRALMVADLEAMPDDGHRYELLDGVLIVSPARPARPAGARCAANGATRTSYSAAAARFAVEVLSPSTRLFDLNLKKAAYEAMGAASFWLIDPKTVELWAYDLDDAGAYRLVAHVTGAEEFAAQHPFPVTVRPADLPSPPSRR